MLAFSFFILKGKNENENRQRELRTLPFLLTPFFAFSIFRFFHCMVLNSILTECNFWLVPTFFFFSVICLLLPSLHHIYFLNSPHCFSFYYNTRFFFISFYFSVHILTSLSTVMMLCMNSWISCLFATKYFHLTVSKKITFLGKTYYFTN